MYQSGSNMETTWEFKTEGFQCSEQATKEMRCPTGNGGANQRLAWEQKAITTWKEKGRKCVAASIQGWSYQEETKKKMAWLAEAKRRDASRDHPLLQFPQAERKRGKPWVLLPPALQSPSSTSHLLTQTETADTGAWQGKKPARVSSSQQRREGWGMDLGANRSRISRNINSVHKWWRRRRRRLDQVSTHPTINAEAGF